LDINKYFINLADIKHINKIIREEI